MYVDYKCGDLLGGIHQTLADYGVCIVKGVLDELMVKKSQERLIRESSMFHFQKDNCKAVIDYGYVEWYHHNHESGIFSRSIHSDNGISQNRSIDTYLNDFENYIVQTEQLREVLNKLFWVDHASKTYSQLAYLPNRSCNKPKLDMHVDIDLNYNLVFQAIDQYGHPDDRLYFSIDDNVKKVQLCPDEVLILPGEEANYEPVLHGVVPSNKKRYSQFLLIE
jgi:hypothetical protein